MTTPRWRQWATLLLAAFLPVAVQAQSKTTSAIAGTVTDESGAALPGATVEVSSSSMIGGMRVLQSDAGGKFRLPEIVPGIYVVRVSLEGFQATTTRDISLRLGETTNVRITLKIKSLEESVDVVADAAAIDVHSSATSANLDNAYLQNLPTARFQPDVLNLAPGINMSTAFGAGEDAANNYEIDGIDTSDPDGGTPWSFVNYNIIEQVELVGLGAPAEYGSFTGVVFNSITKSGSNNIHGLTEALFTNHSLTGTNVDTSNPDLANINPTTKQQIDSTAQIGGPFIKDKSWYFVSGQYFKDQSSSGGPIRQEIDPRAFGKLSSQLNPSNTLETSLEWDRYDVNGRGGNSVTPLEATVKESAPEFVWNATWRSVVSQDTTLDVSYGGWNGYYYLDPQNGYNIAGHEDGATGIFNTNSTYFYKANRTRDQLNASVTHHAENFIHGEHDFKFGMELERSTVHNRYGYTTGTWFYDNTYIGYQIDPGNPGGGPVYYGTIGYSGGGYDVQATNQRATLFAQDSWRVSPRFTVNAGLRAEFNRGKVASGTVYKSNPIAPRLGFAFDASGDGKTVVKGHYGRYYEKFVGAQYYWVAPGAFEPSSQEIIFPSGAVQSLGVTAASRYAIDPNLRPPYLDQVILGVDREVAKGMTASLTLIYRKNKDFVETVSRDGIFVPVTGTVRETGRTVTLFDYRNPADDTLIVTNPKGLHRDYRAAMFTLNKRLTGRWQLAASYLYSRARGNIDNLSGFNSAYGGNNPGKWLDTPNSLAFAEGTLTHDQTNQIKLQGTYLIPEWHLSFSGNYTYYTGDTYNLRSNCLLVDGACYNFNQGSFRFFGEPRGIRRLPAHNQIDLRGEWSMQAGPGRFGVMFDAFNITNQGVATVVEDRAGSSFEVPLSYTSPRQFRIGLRYTW